MKYFKRNINPFSIIIGWIILSCFLTLIIMIVLGLSTPGGEQLPLSFLGRMLPIIVYVILALSILTIPFFIEWIKKRWFMNAAFIILSCLFIYKNWLANKHALLQYDEVTVPIKLGDKVYLKKMEYYGNDFKKVRSISFPFNGKRDSSWTIYDTLGGTIEQQDYRNDSLMQLTKYY